jgi:ribonuclease Z
MRLTFLGTSSATPTKTRNVSSSILKLRGETWLFDCGESTSRQMLYLPGQKVNITKVFITHLHG